MSHTKEKNNIINNFLYSLGNGICATKIELVIYNFILQRTLRFSKILEKISYEEFLIGDRSYCSLGTFLSTRNLHRALVSLRKKNIICTKKTGQDILYGINTPSILELLLEVETYADVILQSIAFFRESLSSMGIGLKKITLSEETKMMLEDAIKKGKEKNHLAKKNKIQKLKDGDILYNPTKVYDLICVYSQEYSVINYDRMTAKLQGQIKNWIKDCILRGVDINKRIKDLCQYWRCFNKSLVNEEGKSLILLDGVSFECYYNNQRYIDVWLDEKTTIADNKKENINNENKINFYEI